ncbi:hypothetical protein HO173_001095 [Letharia columbiana]|uniref:Uncharacterized protein n=1 Tax=Letharia columbiana TaxID=112416 RepID=A0A8H6L962_9LECA|nr:uncharacterized protein HO173_001095 [Letharia columbiana]KAF6240427.1 hypothetical protein HO173_001095 [Letharia columbiana]
MSLQASFKTGSFAQSFTWGLGRRNQLLASCRRCRISNSAQSLAQRRAGIPQSPKRATPKPSQTPISGSRKPAAYEPLNKKLALRTSPTLLYQASSYGHYLFGCYAIGGGLLAAAWFNFRTQFYVQPGGVPQWVPVFTSVGSFMIACGGFWMLFKPQNMVRTISTLPSSSKSGPGSRSLLLQIERTPILPFRRRKLVTVPPGDVTISSHMFNDDAEQKLEATIAEITLREERLRAFAKTNLLTLPFRQAGYWMWRGFMGTRRAFTSEGFHYLHVRGNNRVWKLGKDPAWALDDGKALDKLVKIKLA